MTRTRKARDTQTIRHSTTEARSRLFLEKDASIVEEQFHCSTCNAEFLRAGRFWKMLTSKIEAGQPVFCSTKCRRKYARNEKQKDMKKYICAKCKGGFAPAPEEEPTLQKKVEMNVPVFCTPLCRSRYVSQLVQEVLIEGHMMLPADAKPFDISKMYPDWEVYYWPSKGRESLSVILTHKDTQQRKAIKLSRLVMENYLGRYLSPQEMIKFKDRNPVNITPDNMYIKVKKGGYINGTKSDKTRVLL